MQRHIVSKTALLICLLLLIMRFGPAGSAASSPSPSLISTLERLLGLQSSISTLWRNNDKVAFKDEATAALAVEIPKALLKLGAEVVSKIDDLKFLSPIFSMLSTVADAMGQTVFSEHKQFAELYAFLQEKFSTLNALIESTFHAIEDLKSLVQCDQTIRGVKDYKTQVSGFFGRYKEITERALTDPSGAMALFDSELPQYQSTKVLLGLYDILKDKSLYANIVASCTRGNLQEYLRMMVELHHTLKQAIILDSTAKIRLYNLTQQTLQTERESWANKVDQVATLMRDTAADLVNKSWYNFYKSDVDSSLSSSAGESASNAGGKLNTALTAKYEYVRTAVIVIPSNARSISIVDAFGAEMKTVGQDSFICYRGHRANGDTVIVFCRNQFNYPNEQTELNNAYATYSQGVLSVSLLDALRNNHLGDINEIMTQNKVSFFALKLEVSLSGGSVSTAQSDAAHDLVFFQPGIFRALVIAKLTTGTAGGQAVATLDVKSTAAVGAQWPVIAVPAAILLIWTIASQQMPGY